MKIKRITAALFVLCVAAAFGITDEVRVSTAEELVRAVRSDRIIILAPGTYDLSTVRNLRSRYVSWNSVFDGREIAVKGVKNLEVRGETENGAEIVASPRYAFVLSFQDCAGLKLSRLNIGHTDAGECTGGVVRLLNCSDVEVSSCTLYGSGTVGVEAEGAKGLVVADSTVTRCSFAAFSLTDCEKVRIETVSLRENEGYPLMGIFGKSDVTFSGCDVLNNRGSSVFSLDESSCVDFSSGRFAGNEMENFSTGGAGPRVAETIFELNSFPGPGDEEGGHEGEAEGAGDFNEVVIEFSGAAFLLPVDWTHELHEDEEGSASFNSPDGAAMGFFLPLNEEARSATDADFDRGKKALDGLFKKNVGFLLNLEPAGAPFMAGDITRRRFEGGLELEGKRVKVRTEILAMHGWLFALCVIWQDGSDYEEAADFIFESVRQLEAVG